MALLMRRCAAIWSRNSHAGAAAIKDDLGKRQQQTRVSPEALILYKAKWMKLFRIAVRWKIFQLGGAAALVFPLAQYTEQGSLPPETVVASIGVIFGATGASCALWFYSRRYIGEIALVPPYPDYVRIGVLDFWGNRENFYISKSKIVPPFKDCTRSELTRLAYQTLVPFTVIGQRQFCLSVRHGNLLHKNTLFALLDGTLDARNFKQLVEKDTTTTANDEDDGKRSSSKLQQQ